MFAAFQINKITFSLVAEKYITRYTNTFISVYYIIV